jgi:uncharacterized membrane protein YeaQ/YmgE (transglycosylase-associated protein family)
MKSGGIKLLLSIVILGFVGGTCTYLAFDFLLNPLTTTPLLAMLSSPLFISGILGAAVAVTIVLIYARASR